MRAAAQRAAEPLVSIPKKESEPVKRVTESLATVSQRIRSRKRRRAKPESSCIISNPLCHPFHGFRYCFYAIEGLRAPCWRTLRSTPSLLICRPLHGLFSHSLTRAVKKGMDMSPVTRAFEAGGQNPQKFSAVFASRWRSLASVFGFAFRLRLRLRRDRPP